MDRLRNSVMNCVQCGHPHPWRIGRARYSCRSCGAVFRAALPPPPAPDPPATPDPGREERPPAPESTPTPVPAPAGAAESDDPLAAFMPARMVRWVRQEAPPGPGQTSGQTSGQATGQAIVPDAPDRATLARWYKDFDALVARAATAAEARAVLERVSDVPLDRLPAKPPAFNKVCAALHATCYDPVLAVARLGGQESPYVTERVAHLRRWLATAGRSTTWLEAPPAPPPAPEAVEELLTPPETFTTEQVRTLFAALFGVDKGPSVPGVRERFGADGVREALLAYLDAGARPLRDAVAADLARAATAVHGDAPVPAPTDVAAARPPGATGGEGG
ncbi:hypothetical protein ACGF0J_29080 [Nonomuraea sp. NPDC047897]|uniref:hypothetical protein n=1 Tax=Nonomuraea sp. NPDC047897 TaxID=3364346 RepID=UPI0037222CAA